MKVLASLNVLFLLSFLIVAGMAAVRYQAKITFPSGKIVDCWHTDIYALRGESWVAVWSQATQLPPIEPMSQAQPSSKTGV